MSLQTVKVEITGLQLDTLNAIDVKARKVGKSVEEYLRNLIETDVLSDKPFSEILEPIRQSFDQSGMSEEELDALFENAREAVYREGAGKE